MNKIRIGLLNLLAIVALVLPWSAIEAVESYEAAGQINKLDISTIKIDERSYRINPVVEVNIAGKKDANLKDLKKGDSVWLKINVIGGVHYVVIIKLLPSVPS